MAIYYPGLKGAEFNGIRDFVIGRILELRSEISKQIPRKTLDGNLIVGSWNLRDFGRLPGHGFNPEARLPESFYYIAQILDAFDVVAVQEVNDNMSDFFHLMSIMGRHYDYISTDVTEGSGGNDERMVFVYDTRKVSFQKIAGEIVLPSGASDVTQFARTPYVVSFQCGWLKFDLCTAHLYYGEDTGEKKARRIQEIANLGAFMKKRADKNHTNTFILGDFNVVGPNDETWKALVDSGFVMPDAVRDVKTNYLGSKFYDRIAYVSAQSEVKFVETQSGGTFKFFDHVFRDTPEDKAHYNKVAKNMGDNYRNWSTWQMSDHFPLWVNLKTDFADSYLDKVSKLP